MIKLIATDLDGTLLNDKKQLPHNFKEILYSLKNMGIEFAVASGRSFTGCNHIFGDMAKDIYFICDNGAFTVCKNEVTDIQLIEKENCHQVFDCIKEIGNVDALVCGKKGTYYSHCDVRMKNIMTNFYTNTTFVESLYEIEDDIFKISVCDFNNPLENSYPYLSKKLGSVLSIHPAGNIWVDTMKKGIDKGVGLEKLMQRLNIGKQETIAFGDFYNDIPLLQKAEYSFVMDTAPQEVKKYATHIAENCNNEGVTKAIAEYVIEKSKDL